MPVTRRQGSRANGISHGSQISMSTEPLLPKSPETHLLTYEESLRLLPWQTDNAFVLTGYRRQLRSIRACLWSAVAYLHNETVNIHTHSLGALFFLVLIPLHLLPTHFPSLSYLLPTRPSMENDPLPVPPAWQDKLAFTVYLLSAVGCLGLSSGFHTVQCHSQGACDAAHRGDYIGIVVLIVGSILPGMYYGFDGSQHLQAFYMAAILIAGVTSAYIVLSPHHRSHRWHRTLTFIALGLSAVVPVLHVLLTQGLVHARERMSLDLVIATGVAYIFGALLYAARIPEKFSPGSFDYFGSSHQIFHVMVLVGAWCQYAALRGMVFGRAMAVGR
ncbi:hemolysin-III related-domain-containing protein [Naematelia encephala]|uniref:Hemolysin-III related-domain-containing protein n=1 Tax=Naematelia encephala TaxID=71784 RepID=A0A1Y2B4H2_9TREE|nr:hemolysin-III related-domain-containing protein [Naematelia encephala]